MSRELYSLLVRKGASENDTTNGLNEWKRDHLAWKTTNFLLWICVLDTVLRQHNIKQAIVYVIDSQAVVVYWGERRKRMRFNKPDTNFL